MPELHVSPAGRQLIERNEGCRLQAYQDVVDVWTIGYGCTGPGISEGVTITQAEADQMLSDRLAREFEPGISRLIGAVPTAQGQFDAMVSLAFNIGVGAFAHSSVLRDHVAGNYSAAADAFLMWDKAGGRVLAGLSRRRGEERIFYLGSATPQPNNTASASNPATPSEAITDLQRRLNAKGIDPQLEVDGIFGPDTRDALRAFQENRGQPVTGIPDAATVAALQ